jgi:hypothetical protein
MSRAIIAILGAGLAGWIFGAVWYTVLGKPWQRALGLNPDDCKDKKMPMAPMVASFIVALVMSALLLPILAMVAGNSHGLLEWRAAVPAAVTGLILGIGFVFCPMMVNNMFQQRPFTLTVIDGLHWTFALTIEAVVVVLLA